MTPFGLLRVHKSRILRLGQTAGVTYLGMALSLVSAPLLARELGADGRGVLAGSFVLVQLLSWSTFLGLPRGLAVQELRSSAASSSGIAVVGFLGPISALLAVGLSAVASNGDERIRVGICVAASILVFSGLSAVGVERALLRGHLNAVNVGRALNLVLPSLGIILAYACGTLSIQSAFLITLSGQALAVLFGLYLMLPLWRSRAVRRAPWRFSLHYWGGAAFDGIGARVDQLILAACVAPAELGVYAVAVTCAGAAGGLTQALNQLSYSTLARLGASGNSASLLQNRAIIGVLMSSASGLAILLVVAQFGEWLFGKSFEGLVPVVSILVIAQVLIDQWQLRTYADSASGEPAALMWASATAMAALVVAASLLAAFGSLSGITMALVLVGFASIRLAVRRLVHKRRLARRPPA